MRFQFYGRFLSNSTVTKPTTTMAMNKPMIAGTKYRSAADCGVSTVGVVVACGCFVDNEGALSK